MPINESPNPISSSIYKPPATRDIADGDVASPGHLGSSSSLELCAPDRSEEACHHCGSLQGVMSSMLISLVMEYLSLSRDYRSMMLVNRSFNKSTQMFFVHVEVPASAAHAVPPRLLHKRPFSLWVDTLAPFTRRLRLLLNPNRLLRQNVPFLPINDETEEIEGVTDATTLPQVLNWNSLLRLPATLSSTSLLVSPAGTPQHGRRPSPSLFAPPPSSVSLSTLSRSEQISSPRTWSPSSSPPASASSVMFVVQPCSMVITNSMSSGYDSDGVTHHFDLDAAHLPFFEASMPLLSSSLRDVTICQFSGALESLVALWEAGHAFQLSVLRLQLCSLSEGTLTRALACPQCPKRIIVEGPFSLTPQSTGLGSARSPSHRGRSPSPIPPGGLTNCDSLRVHALSNFSPIPASGIRRLRLSILEVLEPSSWYSLCCNNLVTLHIDSVSCNPHEASLDLDFSSWSSLLDVFVGHCESVTALQASPRLKCLHLKECTMHFCGRFVGTRDTEIILKKCHGASPRIEFVCGSLCAEQWTGRPFSHFVAES